MKNIINKYNIRPQKHLGQNFLVDKNIQKKILQELDPVSGETILEIGAGLGMLTSLIADAGAHVLAVECDKKLCNVLTEELVSRYPLLVVLPYDILDMNIAQHLSGKKCKVVGNIPYNITSPILFHLIRYRQVISQAVLTVQKEVGERLLAMPGSKQYGRLTVSLRFFSTIKKLFVIKPKSFFPIPKVSSLTVQVTFHDTTEHAPYETLFLDVVKALFQERRKKVINGLCLLRQSDITKKKAAMILKLCKIDSSRRAEELELNDFIAITRTIAAS